MINSYKMPLLNPFAPHVPTSSGAGDGISALGAGPATTSSLPPGLAASSWVTQLRDDPRKSLKRKMGDIASLETFGCASDGDEDDDDDDWIKDYIVSASVSLPDKTPSSSSSSSSDLPLCKNCDRSFPSPADLDLHVTEHEVCGVDGCPYEAHPKLVLNHYKSQHMTGLAGKVWNVTSPEEIARWREERKRNYPTASRVAKKEAEKRAKRKRGNVLNNEFFGKILKSGRGGQMNGHRGHSRGRGRALASRGRGGQRGRGHRFAQDDRELISDSDESSLDELETFASATAPTAASEELANRDAGDAGQPTSMGNLGGLVADYASSDDEDDVNDDEKTKIGADDDDESAKISVVSKSSSPKKKKKRKKKKKEELETEELRLFTDGQIKYQLTSRRRCRDPTLLERLLAPDIRKERNYILQCVRFVVKKNFFD